MCCSLTYTLLPGLSLCALTHRQTHRHMHKQMHACPIHYTTPPAPSPAPAPYVVLSATGGVNNESKKIAVRLEIKALPTFHFYRDNVRVGHMTGAEMDKFKGLVAELK